MRSTTITAFPLFSLVLGAVNWSALESCVTQSGTASVKTVSTSVSTTTVQQPDILVKHTFHPQHLVTPRPFTKTWTHTFQETDTAVSTVVVHLTHTEFVPNSTIVNTYTQTEVSSVYTTVPAPSDFLPISNTTNSAYPNGQSLSSSASTSKSSALQSSSMPAAASGTAAARFNMTASASGNDGSGASAGTDGSANLDTRNLKNLKQFAHAVHCLKSVLVQKTVDTTTTGTTQTSTLAQATVTATVSATITAMVQPKFGHGKTVYTTSYTTVTKGYNVYSNKFVTAQVTSTVKAYAACQTNNVINALAPPSGKAKSKTTVAGSAQQCCEQCQQTSNCVGSAFQALLPLGGRCIIYYADTCPAQSANSLQYTLAAPKQSLGTYALSNGVCGYMFSAAGQVKAHGHG
ncbi:unnamed protein product [Aureobasidium vineae]|uniref:Apple domain-containing protein n=1 Tax=Aureobasidium vineae TaxID=2773715 RepID=A0A9N8JIR3_9PEZI|nr:unnamed protein product [Aureobasidium vineae]